LAPTVLSIERLSEGRLQGGLFSDLAALREVLPESTAIAHLVADLHTRLGEWDSARALYEALIEEEPENGSALLNLGVCHLHQGDQAQAMMHFQRAAKSEDAGAAARFNMSQVLSELYRFKEAERELRIAQQQAPRQVGEWLRQVADRRAIVFDGGLSRADEIRDQLVSSWNSDEAEGRWSAVWPRFLSLPLAVAFLAIAAGLHLIIRRGQRAVFRPADKLAPRGTWRSTLLVGFAEVENDRPLKGFLLILLMVMLVSLPWAAELGYRLPWIYGPGGGVASVLAAAGLAIFALSRLVGHSRGTL
jgi:tetratricopeptide (TPR) repeat protein